MREHKRAEIAHAKCERGRQLVCDAFQCYEFHFIALLLFDRHPIQAGAGCSQKNLGWYVTFEFSVGDVAECCDSHWCALDSWVVCKLRLPQSGWLKHLSGVRQLLFRAKRRGSSLRRLKNNFSQRCKTCRAAGLHWHNSGDCAEVCTGEKRL